MSNSKIPGSQVNKPNNNPTIDSDESYYEIPFYKDYDYMFSIENEVAYIKAVERLVRSSKYYSRYIAHMKNDLGMNFCQVKGNISEDEDAGVTDLIEMHHGPIFTLFDVTSIILNYMLAKEMKITTFSVANRVIEEHFKHRVQTVMLCKTVHQLVHDNKVFLNYKQGFGDLYSFLETYYEGLDETQINNIINYIEKCKKYDSNDFGNLEVIVTRWKTEHHDFDDEM